MHSEHGIRRALPFIAPGLTLVVVFILYPMVRNIAISLSDYNLVQNTITLKGFEHYRALMTGYQGRFWFAYRNNGLYALVTTPVTLVVGLLSAVAINSLNRRGVFFRTAYYLPVVTSWIVIGLVFKYLFNPGDRGLVNHVLTNVLHVMDTPVNWLKEEWPGNSVIWMLGVWKGIGYPMLIYLAAIQSVPNDVYEAATIEGAGFFATVRRITVPLIKPATFFLIVQSLIGSFNVFLQVLILTNGDPRGKTGVLQFLMYQRIFELSRFGEGAAIGVMTAISVFLVTILLKRTLRAEEYTF